MCTSLDAGSLPASSTIVSNIANTTVSMKNAIQQSEVKRMDPRFKKLLTRQNLAIVGGTVLVILFWREIIFLGAVIAVIYLVSRNREKIKNILHIH